MKKTQLSPAFHHCLKPILLLLLLILPGLALAAPSLDAVTVTTGADGEQNWSITIQALVLMTV
ncbi:MAG: hypothetical protein KZQ74_01020 [gamma proteobacterium symbiont of Bathyaustriella thionipta]|nr:hypothetical protein [gamma proteobacterium symbiont of Bathyaustriella thionipta]